MNIFNFKSDKTVIVYELLKSALGLPQSKPFLVAAQAPVLEVLPAAGGFGGSNACAAQVFFGPARKDPQD
jgi:hypothetical protein